MLLVPTRATPSQQFSIVLNDQACSFSIYQRSTGLYMDVLVNDDLIIGGVICLNLNVIVRSAYLGFIGDMVWVDTQGDTDPYYTTLGTRYRLIYLAPEDLPSGLS